MIIIVKEWLRCPKAFAAKTVHLIGSVVWSWLFAQLIILISNCVTDIENYKHYLFWIILVLVIQCVLSIIKWASRNYANATCYTYLSNRYHEKIIQADYDMFTKFTVAKVNTTAGFLQDIIGGMEHLHIFLNNAATIIITLIAMYQVSGIVAAPMFGVCFISFIGIKIIYKHYKEINEKEYKTQKKRDQETEDVVDGFAEVRSFATQSRHISKIKELNQTLVKISMKRIKINNIFEIFVDLMEGAGVVFVIVYSIGRIQSGIMNAAQVMTLVTYVFRLIDPVINMIEFVNSMSQYLAKKNDYIEIMNYQSQAAGSNSVTLSGFRDKIELKDVSFKYNDSAYALSHLDMTIRKGQSIGICGESGGGKSTLFKLLNRFYRPEEGIITIDGIDLNDISNESLRRKIGSVHQDNVLFPTTIRNNVAYGSPHATDVEIVEACKKAQIYDFITSLPEGFDTEVGPRGLKLSGGQKQRIALARVFLRNPEIIILDEATSALDNKTEEEVQLVMEEMGKTGHTMITIAHRLSTIRDCDIIYVIKNGSVVERGSHDDLVKLDGEYAAMLKS